jgi:hypothetical protein
MAEGKRITGYSFGDRVRCPECVGWMLVSSFTPSGRDREPLRVEEVERLLYERAKAAHVDRDNESTFDERKDFPKRIYEGDERKCSTCSFPVG